MQEQLEPYLDVFGRPLLLSCRVLKSTSAEGLSLVQGRVMKVQLAIALKLIRLGYCERANPRKSSSRRRREKEAKTLKEAANAS